MHSSARLRIRPGRALPTDRGQHRQRGQRALRTYAVMHFAHADISALSGAVRRVGQVLRGLVPPLA